MNLLKLWLKILRGGERYHCHIVVITCDRPLTEEYIKVLETSFDLLKKPSTGQHRKLHTAMETQVQELWTQFKLFEKAIPYFQG